MKTLAPLLAEIRKSLNLSAPSGMAETSIPGVHLFWSDKNLPRSPLFYEPGIAIIAQGFKIGYLGHQSFRYDAENYLVVTVPCPAECESHATLEEPLLGVFVEIDLPILHQVVQRLVAHIPEPDLASANIQRSIEPVPLKKEMAETAERLVQSTRTPVEADMLGPGLINEIIFRAVIDDHGKALLALTQSSSSAARISKVLTHIHDEYRQFLSIEDLAKIAGMSTSAFHRDFKIIVGQSPLQYVKRVRLDKAKTLLAEHGATANAVSSAVGYASPSQFSREFRRCFGVTPATVKSST